MALKDPRLQISHMVAMGEEREKSDDTSFIVADSGSSASSSDADTYSLDDLISDYPVHFGRTYHKYKAGSYPFPNDRDEMERMDQQWCMIKACQGGSLFTAPVQNPKNVLEVGTGTGIWVMSVADDLPDAKITGIDLSPIQPTFVPENVVFEQQDCSENDWCRPLGKLDLIYSQSMMGSLQDFGQYLINARKYLSPGTGWIECCEPDPMPVSDDNTIPPQWPVKVWSEWMDAATQKLGRPLRIGPKLKQWMLDAGYVDVHEVIFKMPLGAWPADPQLKKVGKSNRLLLENTFAAASYYLFTKVMDMTPEKVEIFLGSCREALQNKKVHAYYRCYAVYGRRPSPEEEQKMGRMAPPPKPKSKPKQ